MNLNLYAPFNTVSYGYVASYFAQELLKLGVDMSYWPISQIGLEQRFADLVPMINQGPLVKNGPCLKIWHQFDLGHFIGSGPTVAMPIFELDQFSEIEKNHMNHVDLLLVNSQWAKSVCDKELSRDPETTKVIPLGVNTEIFKPYVMLGGKTIFGNFGKWELRKGHDILSIAFNKAFETTDDVELWLMPHNHMLKPNQVNSWRNSYLATKLGSKVSILDRQETQEQVYNTMRYIHCAVFPYRAEGWNLEGLEAMACGKHVIATNYSGPTEYCNSDNSLLLDVSEFEKAEDGLVFFGQGNWAKFTNDMIDQLVEHMRFIHKTNMEGNLKENSKGVETAKQFTWTNAAKQIYTTLGEL